MLNTVNSSLITGVVPATFKSAVVKPLRETTLAQSRQYWVNTQDL